MTTIYNANMSGDNLPPRHIILSDELGGQWAVSVRPDGQLQTAQWPDGEPLTPTQHAAQAMRQAVRGTTPSGALEIAKKAFVLQTAAALTHAPSEEHQRE